MIRCGTARRPTKNGNNVGRLFYSKSDQFSIRPTRRAGASVQLDHMPFRGELTLCFSLSPAPKCRSTRSKLCMAVSCVNDYDCTCKYAGCSGSPLFMTFEKYRRYMANVCVRVRQGGGVGTETNSVRFEKISEFTEGPLYS